MLSIGRRTLISGALAFGAVPLRARAGPPASGRLGFAVSRNGKLVGQHLMTFITNGDTISVSTDADLVIKIGPVPVFRYKHHCQERWKGGRIVDLRSRTDSNGKIETVNATRTPTAVILEGNAGRITAPAAAAPLTHWNAAVLEGPLFNPQTGKMLKVSAADRGRDQLAGAPATHWSLRGESTIDDWYDAGGVWLALKGVLNDKSIMEYKRI
jgi:hypothetical protein